MTNKITLHFDLTIESESKDETYLNEIGTYIAADVFRAIYNGDDFLQVKYAGYDTK